MQHSNKKVDEEQPKEMPIGFSVSLLEFPSEVLLVILPYLSISELATLALVNSVFYHLSKDDYYWRQAYQAYFGGMPVTDGEVNFYDEFKKTGGRYKALPAYAKELCAMLHEGSSVDEVADALDAKVETTFFKNSYTYEPYPLGSLRFLETLATRDTFFFIKQLAQPYDPQPLLDRIYFHIKTYLIRYPNNNVNDGYPFFGEWARYEWALRCRQPMDKLPEVISPVLIYHGLKSIGAIHRLSMIKVAMEEDNAEAVKLFVKSGFFSSTEIDLAPVLVTAKKQHLEIYPTLLSELSNNFEKIFSKNSDYSTYFIAFLTTVTEGDLIEAFELVFHRVSVDKLDLREKSRLFKQGVEQGSVQICHFLLTQGLSIDLRKNPELIATAIRQGHLEILKFLLERNKDKLDLSRFTIPGTGKTLLQYACRYRQVEIVKYLLQAGANPNVVNDDSLPLFATVAHYSDTDKIDTQAEKGLEIAKLLLQHGADVNAVVTVRNSKTVLFKAIAANDDNLVALLLQQPGINLKPIYFSAPTPRENERDRYGDSPLHYALRLKRSEAIIRLLIQKNPASVDFKNRQGAKPMEVATGQLKEYAMLCLSEKSIKAARQFFAFIRGEKQVNPVSEVLTLRPCIKQSGL